MLTTVASNMSGEASRYSMDQSGSSVSCDSFCWGITPWCWSVSYGSKENGALVRLLDMKKFWLNLSTPGPQVKTWTDDNRNSQVGLMWKLIPVKIKASETMGQGSPPSYEGDSTGQSSARTQHAESECDDFGTIVTEVTTTTTTTRRRYRVEDT